MICKSINVSKAFPPSQILNPPSSAETRHPCRHVCPIPEPAPLYRLVQTIEVQVLASPRSRTLRLSNVFEKRHLRTLLMDPAALSHELQPIVSVIMQYRCWTEYAEAY